MKETNEKMSWNKAYPQMPQKILIKYQKRGRQTKIKSI